MKSKIQFLAFAAVLLIGSLLSGCATSPSGASSSNDAALQLATSVAINVAVERVVTRDRATQADIEARAGRIVIVTNALKALGSDKLTTLPLIRAALAPQLDKLGLTPFERNQADLLVDALITVALERVDVSQYEARVSFILDAVTKSALGYLPAATPAPPG